MGILVAGLIGQVRNKIGNMVMSNWKGINTARAYAVPANPNSTAQQAQRGKFATVVALAQNLLGTLITTFVNPFAVQMSGFNYFIKLFIANATSEGLVTALCQVTKGTLESTSISSAIYNTSTGDLEVTFPTSASGNGTSDDNVSLLVLDNATNAVLGYGTNLGTRSVGSVNVTIPTGLLAADLVAFIWLSRGTGSEFIVSNSIGSVCSAA